MITTLISVDSSLASQIALRFCCQMAKMAPMDIRSIHIEESAQGAAPAGTGWVRQTWESSTLETARNEMAGMMEELPSACPISRIPKLVVGDPDEEICQELARGRYDLFVEGMLHNFHPASFCHKIKTRRFRGSNCPVLLVKNKPAFRKAAFFTIPGDWPGPLVNAFGKFFPKDAMEIDLVEVRNGPGLNAVSGGRRGNKDDGAVAGSPEKAQDIAGYLAEEGWTLRHHHRVGELAQATGFLRNYSVVASYFPKNFRQNDPFVKVLNQVPTANLMCSLK